MATFAPLSVVEEDGTISSLSEAPPTNSFKRRTVVLVAMLLMGSALAVSTIRSTQGVAAADTQSLQSFYSALKSLDIDLDKIDIEKTLNTSSMPKDALRELLAYKRRLKMPFDSRELATATCAVDVTQGTYFLERAALAITAATASCKGGSAHVQAACAADIAGVYSSFAFVASYISEAVAQCEVGRDKDAECAAGISGVVANTGRIAVQAATMAGTCSKGAAYDKPVGDSVWQMTRRLQGENFIAPTYDERGMELATCTLDIPQAATYLAMFGIAIDRASKNCDRVDRALIASERSKVTCAAGIMDVISSLFMASSFISSAVSHCAPITNQQALCASGAVGLVGGITGLSKDALMIQNGCDPRPFPIPTLPPFPTPPATPVPTPAATCTPVPAGCPTDWAKGQPPDCATCPSDGICSGGVCFCNNDELKVCADGATCYSSGTIGSCEGSFCCAVKRIDECNEDSECKSSSIGKCQSSSKCVESKKDFQ